MKALVGFFAVLATSAVAVAADGPSCVPFDRTPACCPHEPPTCCAAEVAAPIDDSAVAQICGAKQAKGQSNAMQSCKRYYTKGDVQAEIVFGRQPGDDAALAKLRIGMTEGRARVSDVQIRGAQQAFLVRTLDETGRLEKTSVWAHVGAEIVYVEAERTVCDETQVTQLLVHAIERLAPPRTQAIVAHTRG
jgi:hypothetical protein